MKKAPFRGGEVEVRQVATADDFGDAMTPELREQEDRLRADRRGAAGELTHPCREAAP